MSHKSGFRVNRYVALRCGAWLDGDGNEDDLGVYSFPFEKIMQGPAPQSLSRVSVLMDLVLLPRMRAEIRLAYVCGENRQLRGVCDDSIRGEVSLRTGEHETRDTNALGPATDEDVRERGRQ